MAPSLDTMGPIASDAVDIALTFSVLTGGAPDPETLPRPRLGIARDPWLDACEPEIVAAVEGVAKTLEKSSAILSDVSVSWFERAHDAWLVIALAEFAREYRSLVARMDDLDPSIQVIVRAGMDITPEREHEAREVTVEARAAFDASLEEVDAILLPATPHAAPKHEDEMVSAGNEQLAVHLGGPARFAMPINVVGAPALVLPVGATASGLPFGVQLVGQRGAENLLIGLGETYQRETDWHTRVPPVHA
jgi:aspartyl-tRNA(Asn)/glutamyl-tRNA(Gln) amidotransferase subunit A